MKLNPARSSLSRRKSIGGLVQRGQCFVQVDLVRGFDGPLVTIGTLLQGYAGTFMGLAYPGSPIIGPLEGPGYVRLIDGALPAPGANIAEVAPPRAVAHLLAFNATLTTSAVAGTRSVMLFLQDSATKIWWRAPSIYLQGPGLTVGYSWQPGMTLDDRKPNTAVAVPLPWPHRSMGRRSAPPWSPATSPINGPPRNTSSRNGSTHGSSTASPADARRGRVVE
jgi:hypothetical protein